jgi:hypothetical protein
MASQVDPICRFYRLIPDAPDPRRADRSADGMLPTRAYRYCQPAASASGYGFYLFPPMDFTLRWDGTEIWWAYKESGDWYALRGAQYPGFAEFFESAAPDEAKTLKPGFLIPNRERGSVQIWSGYLARTAPGWSLCSRGPVNIPVVQPYQHFEGIVETDSSWFGPLFTNIQLTQTNSPIRFHRRYPLFQVQPILRQCYVDPAFEVLELSDLGTADWQRYIVTMTPNTDELRLLGHHAVETRKRVRRQSAGSAR